MRFGPWAVKLLLGATILLALLLLAVAPASSATSGERLIAEGPAPDLILLYSGDVIGYLGPCG